MSDDSDDRADTPTEESDEPEADAPAGPKPRPEPKRRFSLALGWTVAEYLVAAGVAFAFALSFGFYYGVSNHNTAMGP